jgi:hypothetical protein
VVVKPGSLSDAFFLRFSIHALGVGPRIDDSGCILLKREKNAENATGLSVLRSHRLQGEKPRQLEQEDCMTHLVLALALFGSEEVFGNFGLWTFLSVGAVALFGIFIPVVTWIQSREREREAFYKSETIRRVAEASTDGAKATVDLLREQNRLGLIKTREALKIAGVINIGVGIGLVIFLRMLVGLDIALCGLIPGFIGAGMLVYVYVLAEPLD